MIPELLQRYKKLIVILAILAIVVIGAKLGLDYLNSFQKVTVNYDTEIIKKLEIYPAANTRNSVEATGDAIQSISSGEEITLKKGLYALKPTGPKIDSDLIELSLGDQPTVKDLDVDFSDTYLAGELVKELDSITAAIQSSNSGIASLYRINNGKLYHHGEWFGTTLSYGGSDSLSRDTLRVVAKKEDGAWKVLTNPPQIMLSTKQFPSIPLSILSKVNDIDLGVPYVTNLGPSAEGDDHTHAE